MSLYTLVNNRTGEALYPHCAYKTAHGAKIAASKLGYSTICAISEYSYACFAFEKKINGVWTKQED